MEPKWLTTRVDEAWKHNLDTEFFPYIQSQGILEAMQKFYDAYPFPEVDMSDGVSPGQVWEKTIFSAVGKYMTEKLFQLNYTPDQIENLWSDTGIF